jgi:hypothetical protein
MPQQIGSQQDDDAADRAAGETVDHGLSSRHPVGHEANHAPEPKCGGRDDEGANAAVEQHGSDPAPGEKACLRLMQGANGQRRDGECARQEHGINPEPKQQVEPRNPENPKHHEIERQPPGDGKATMLSLLLGAVPDRFHRDSKQPDTENIGDEVACAFGKAER